MEIKKAIPFAITSKRIQYLAINLIKDVKDLHNENFKTLLEEIKGDISKWKDINVHRQEDLIQLRDPK